MLTLRALVRHASKVPSLVRFASNVRTPEDILREIKGSVSGGVFPNTIRQRANGPDARPPTAGVGGYASASQNPLSRQNSASASSKEYDYRMDCHSTRNNTIITFSSLESDEQARLISKPMAWYSGGSVGFKKGNRGGYEAGYQCVVRAFKLLEKLKVDSGGGIKVHLYFRGFGQGREALKTALTTSEGDSIRDTIKLITDRTALKIGGTRSKKTRRL